MQQYILGIDIGTGSTKGVALTLDGVVLATSQQYYPTHQPEPGFSEQDPESIWQAFVMCVQDIIEKLVIMPVAISFSSVMHSLIPVDESGAALNPMITWADVRSEKIAQRIMESPQGENIYRVTGTPVYPMSPLCKLIWLRENNNELFEKAYKFISIKEYVWHKLFGQFEVDYSVASGTGLFDIINLQWSDEACNLAGITAQRLSNAVDTNYIQTGINADTATLLKISASTSFVIGATDGCCANLGSHVTDNGVAALTIGTSGAVRITATKPVYNYPGMTFNYLLNKDTFICGGAANNGGIAVDWLLKTFLDKARLNSADYETLFKIIETIPAGSDGLIFLPYLYGERAPIWDTHSSGAYLNIRSQHTQHHFFRAALEGICYALYDIMRHIEKPPVVINQINVSGGFITSATWVQMLADITGKKLLILQLEDASAIGAIYLAMGALFPEVNLPYPTKSIMIYPDKVKHSVYSKTFPVFKKLYFDLKDSMQLLHQLNNQ